MNSFKHMPSKNSSILKTFMLIFSTVILTLAIVFGSLYIFNTYIPKTQVQKTISSYYASMKDGNIEVIDADCICKVMENTSFDSVEEFERFQNYICYLLFVGELKEPRVLFFRRINKMPVEKYECAKCKATWQLTYPGSSSKGAWKKVEKTR